MTEMELFVRSLLHHGADFMVGMKGQDSKQLAVKIGTIAAVLVGIYMSKKVWGGYRRNFTFSKKLVYIGSKKLAVEGGWGGMLLLPAAVVETVLFPLYLLLGCFSPRSDEEKQKMLNQDKDVIKTLDRHSGLQENLNERLMESEDKLHDLEQHIKRLTDSVGKVLSEVKKNRQEAPTRRVARPAAKAYSDYQHADYDM